MIRVLSVIEARSVTGPVNTIFSLVRAARELPRPEVPELALSAVTYVRMAGTQPAKPGGATELIEAAGEIGIDLDTLPESRRFDVSVLNGLRRLVETRRPDVIETHSLKSHFLLRLSGLARQFPWVAFHHGYTTTDFKMRIYNQLDRWSLRAPDRIVTVSDTFRKQLTRMGIERSRIVVLHNAIDPRWGSALRAAPAAAAKQSLGLDPGGRVILAIGRMSSEKGHAGLITAFSQLRSRRAGANLKLVIVGDGPERPSLAAQVRRLGLDGQVLLPGQQKDVRPFYAAADVFVLPSWTEGSPIVLLEAMCAGVPVVATRVGGIPEIAGDDAALLVPPRDAAALTGAIERLLADAELRRAFTSRAREVLAERHSPQARARVLLDLYAEIRAGRRKAPVLSSIARR
jgi:glycosyltransferase involved in cell wall biosynthesis